MKMHRRQAKIINSEEWGQARLVPPIIHPIPQIEQRNESLESQANKKIKIEVRVGQGKKSKQRGLGKLHESIAASRKAASQMVSGSAAGFCHNKRFHTDARALVFWVGSVLFSSFCAPRKSVGIPPRAGEAQAVRAKN